MTEGIGAGPSRKLGEQERLFHYLHAFGALIAVQVLHIGGRLEPALVRRALAFLQRQHPILRAHMRYGSLVFRSLPPYVYRQPILDTAGTTEIPLRVVENAAPDAWRQEMDRELMRPLAKGRTPRVRAVLVREANDLSHFILTADHATADAQATNMASRDFMEFLADPEAALARTPIHAELPAALEAGLPTRTDSGKKSYEPALRLPPRRSPGGRQAPGLVERRLEPGDAAALKAAVKANRTTLHGALTAAFLLAVGAKYGLAEMTNISTVELRRLAKPPFPAETYGCYIDLLRTRHQIGEEFWALARDVSFKLISTLAKNREAATLLKLPDWGIIAKESLPTMTHQRRLDGLTVTTAGESRLGAGYGPFRLDGVTMAVSTVPVGSGVFVIGSERLGGLDLYICHADYSLSAADATDLTDRAIATLQGALAPAGLPAADETVAG